MHDLEHTEDDESQYLLAGIKGESTDYKEEDGRTPYYRKFRYWPSTVVSHLEELFFCLHG